MIIETYFLKWCENSTQLKLWMCKVPSKFAKISKNYLAFSHTEKTVFVPFILSFTLGPCTFENAGLKCLYHEKIITDFLKYVKIYISL